jgi:hypothetical protein
MPTLVAQVAPQRSSQYAELAATLGPVELALCPLAAQMSTIRPLTLAGQAYYAFDVPELPAGDQWRTVTPLAMTSAFFELFESLENRTGPFLRPIETGWQPALPPDLVATRRYKGKTNEAFTFFMLNIARFSSAFARDAWSALRILDPLAGGGTTLLAGLVLGADVAGVDLDLGDVESTGTFLQQYCREQGLACQTRQERLRGLGHRQSFVLGPGNQHCILAHGETAQSRELVSGFKPHLIVADLPYGIQHQGPLKELLEHALPVWSAMLVPGGALALSWDATRFSRPDMLAFVRSVCPLAVRDDPPYDRIGHRVDRVIKRRDLLVAVTRHEN